MNTSTTSQRPSGSKAAKPCWKRAPKACLRCKSLKIRCNGYSKPDGRCTPCALSMETCQYVDPLGYLNYKQRKHIQALEDRIEVLEALLEKLHPGESFVELETIKAQSASAPELTRIYADQSSIQPSFVSHILSDRRCYGAFSDPRIIRNVMNVKLEGSGKRFDDLLKELKEKMEQERPDLPAWQKRILTPDVSYRLTFPSNDLMASLIDLYFTYYHMYRPILHRPTFETMVRTRVHEKDQYFGGLLLMVCACGARFSDDPRTRQSADDKASAGWIYYEQVHHLSQPMNEPVSLVRLQLYNLIAIFLDGSGLISLEWSLVGTGIRLALDVGAHLNSSFADASLTERELWKRAFWGLFVADQLQCVVLGRKCITSPEDIDLDLPLEVDDEHWDPVDKTMAFVQPPNKPALVVGFNALIRFMCLMRGLAQLTRGPLNETDMESQGDMILEEVLDVDSTFNQWLGSLPPHLQWNPNRADPVHFAQSSMLHALYRKGVIMTHQLIFLLPENQASAANRVTSFAICTDAARFCVHVLHTYSTRVRIGGAPWLFLSSFTASFILWLDVWTGGTNDALQVIRECADSLVICEDSYVPARMARDLYHQLLYLTSLSTSPALQPVASAIRPTNQTVMEELPNIPSRSDQTLPLDVPSTALSTNFYSSDCIPAAFDGEAALSRGWNYSDTGVEREHGLL